MRYFCGSTTKDTSSIVDHLKWFRVDTNNVDEFVSKCSQFGWNVIFESQFGWTDDWIVLNLKSIPNKDGQPSKSMNAIINQINVSVGDGISQIQSEFRSDGFYWCDRFKCTYIKKLIVNRKKTSMIIMRLNQIILWLDFIKNLNCPLNMLYAFILTFIENR